MKERRSAPLSQGLCSTGGVAYRPRPWASLGDLHLSDDRSAQNYPLSESGGWLKSEPIHAKGISQVR
jgi:hypothetical protein